MAPRLSSNCTHTNASQRWNVCPLGATSAAQMSGKRNLLLSRKTFSNKETSTNSNVFHLARIIACSPDDAVPRVLCFKTVASWHMSQTLQHYQCLTVCTLGAPSASQTSGEKASPCHQKPHSTKKKRRLEHVSVVRIFAIPGTCLPAHPSPYCCSPSLMGETTNCCSKHWATSDSNAKSKAHYLTLL